MSSENIHPESTSNSENDSESDYIDSTNNEETLTLQIDLDSEPGIQPTSQVFTSQVLAWSLPQYQYPTDIYRTNFIHEYLEQYGIAHIWKSVLENMINTGWNINAKSSKLNNRSMLSTAVKHNDIEVVEFLVTKNADINIKDNHNTTPLLLASENNYLDIVKILLSCSNIDVNCSDKDGDNSLIVASWKNYPQIIKLLIENNIDIEHKNNIGKTAIDYSIENGISLEDIEKLYKKKLDITINKTDDKCIICYQCIEVGKHYFTCQTCNSSFHNNCLTSWFIIKNIYDKKCPYCKNICNIKINKNI